MSLLFSHPFKKLTLLAAFGGGYVLGAKAGRERYEQIRQTANQVKDDPRVQQAASRAEDLVRDAATKVTEDPRVKDVVSRAEDIVRDAGLHLGDSRDEGDAADKIAEVARASDVATSDGDTDAGTGTVHPLLADEHISLDEEVVYSSGPDIEETIDELAGTDPAEAEITDDKRDDA